MKIVFFGTPRLAQIVLQNLIDSPYKPQLVITGQSNKSGRGLALKANSVEQDAKKHGIEIGYKISAIDKSFDLAILEAFGQIIPKEILNLPKFGFINIHPSLLPKYRGPSPIQTAIIDGQKKTGVTVIKLDEEVDHGPILAQQEVEIESIDTHESLVEKLGLIGSNLLIETLPSYLSGKIKSRAQDDKNATFTQKITKADGFIDLHNPPNPQSLDRMIRAFYPWPSAWTRLKMVNGKWLMVKFLPPTILLTYHPTDPFAIQPEGKRPLSLQQFKNGYPQLYDQIRPLLEKTQSDYEIK